MKNFLIIIFLFSIPCIAQDGFHIENNKAKFKLRYELVNDLVIVPVKLNGVELSFLLDTGVDKTILFSLKSNDSVELKNTESIYIKGLGTDKAVRALQSNGHTIQIGEAINKSSSIFIILEHEMNLSTRMGVPIHGIIGYDFFKDFVVEINYQSRKLKVYDPEKYQYKNCRRCEDFRIELQKNKPYLEVAAGINDTITKKINLLVDTGSGDALWLFQDAENQIQVPENSISDFLGFSLSGSVHGFKSRIHFLKIGNFEFKEVITSFSDTIYTQRIDQQVDRDGSLGSEVLRRFHMIIDYPNRKIRLKANKDYEEAFESDMSGVVIAHAGFAYVIEFKQVDKEMNTEENSLLQQIQQPKFSLKPQYIVVEVRENSPAQIAGLQSGDLLVAINGKEAYYFTLSKITKMLSSEEGKKINMKINRNGVEQTISFTLKRLL